MWSSRLRRYRPLALGQAAAGAIVGAALAPDPVRGALTGAVCGALVGAGFVVAGLVIRQRSEATREGGCWYYVREYVKATEKPVCELCGMILTPKSEELLALTRFGNPLRRPACLESPDGLHRVADDGVDAAGQAMRRAMDDR